MSRRVPQMLGAALAAACCLTALLGATPETSAVADAAMRQEAGSVRALLERGGDVNAAQGDGMTALHWAALHGDADLARMLLSAGANVRAATRIGAYTPLHLASRTGADRVIAALVAAAADVNAATSTGATPLMFAAESGSTAAVKALLDAGATVDARDAAADETALMFAAALDRVDVVRLLLDRGAQARATSKVVDYSPLTPPGDEATMEQARREKAKDAQGAKDTKEARPAADSRARVAGVTRAYTYSELVGRAGGLTPLLFAVRQGGADTVHALVERGADVNEVSAGDHTSPLLMAAVNGQFDIAAYLLEHGADPDLASDAGATPLYATVNVEWAPKSFYPQPRAQYQQHRSYLDMMRRLLDKGANPNARLRRKLWYTQYNFDLLRIDETGATPFWRAAYAADIEAMKLLVSYGADPNVPTIRSTYRSRRANGEQELADVSGRPPVPIGGPGIPPLLAATGEGYGEGFAANAHRYAPTGMLAAVRYLVEELHADVNAADADGNTPLHNAASRGDNAMVLYLVSKGADVKAVNRAGLTTVDMANGPVQRTQPYPETIALLEKLGAKNNHKCVSC
ncbi:MAG: ankyrin repeat domain-containing protein [Betaproteobacteria bacterium]